MNKIATIMVIVICILTLYGCTPEQVADTTATPEPTPEPIPEPTPVPRIDPDELPDNSLCGEVIFSTEIPADMIEVCINKYPENEYMESTTLDIYNWYKFENLEDGEYILKAISDTTSELCTVQEMIIVKDGQIVNSNERTIEFVDKVGFDIVNNAGEEELMIELNDAQNGYTYFSTQSIDASISIVTNGLQGDYILNIYEVNNNNSEVSIPISIKESKYNGGQLTLSADDGILSIDKHPFYIIEARIVEKWPETNSFDYHVASPGYHLLVLEIGTDYDFDVSFKADGTLKKSDSSKVFDFTKDYLEKVILIDSNGEPQHRYMQNLSVGSTTDNITNEKSVLNEVILVYPITNPQGTYYWTGDEIEKQELDIIQLDK